MGNQLEQLRLVFLHQSWSELDQGGKIPVQTRPAVYDDQYHDRHGILSSDDALIFAISAIECWMLECVQTPILRAHQRAIHTIINTAQILLTKLIQPMPDQSPRPITASGKIRINGAKTCSNTENTFRRAEIGSFRMPFIFRAVVMICIKFIAVLSWCHGVWNQKNSSAKYQ